MCGDPEGCWSARVFVGDSPNNARITVQARNGALYVSVFRHGQGERCKLVLTPDHAETLASAILDGVSKLVPGD